MLAKLHFLYCRLYYLIYTFPSRFVLRVKSVRIGRNNLFGGLPYVHIANGAVLQIGNGCRFMSKTVGNFIGINHRCILSSSCPGARLIIGDNCGFSGTSIWCFVSITIGNNVRVGANVVIMDGDAHQDDPRAGKNAPIVIEDNVWIGAGVMVLKGVTIGRNSLIGAGSIVVKDIPANCVAAGNPCKVIRTHSPNIIEQLEQNI